MPQAREKALAQGASSWPAARRLAAEITGSPDSEGLEKRVCFAYPLKALRRSALVPVVRRYRIMVISYRQNVELCGRALHWLRIVLKALKEVR